MRVKTKMSHDPTRRTTVNLTEPIVTVSKELGINISFVCRQALLKEIETRIK